MPFLHVCLRHTASAIAPSVTELFNHSIHTVQLPKDWKVSRVVPIPKRPGVKSPSDFRPVSLLSVLSKVLEKHFHVLITDHLAEHHPLLKCQWGFQPKSLLCPHCSAQPMTGCNNLKHAGNEIDAISLSLKRHFDWVLNQLLVSKLMRLGLDPYIMTWLHNYLANRRQNVGVNGTTSESSHAIEGLSGKRG